MVKDKFTTTKDIYKELARLDFLCKKEGIKAEIVLLGGSAITIAYDKLGETFRPTEDIDMNLKGITNSKENRFREIAYKIGIDEVGGVMEVPPLEDFKESDNITQEFTTLDNITVYLPNIELLTCCKIFSTREKDLQDLTDMGLIEKCNKEKLNEMVQEYKDYLLNQGNMNLNYHQIKGKLK